MSIDKKRFLLNIVSVSLGCSSCRKQKLSSVCQPKQKLQAPTYQKHKKDLYSSSSSSSSTSSSKITAKQSPNGHHGTPNTFSPAVDSTPPHFFSDSGSSMRHCSGAVRGFGHVGDESVVVEKDSDDPYLDFRHSIQLLDCFLQLNSPYYHGVPRNKYIITMFASHMAHEMVPATLHVANDFGEADLLKDDLRQLLDCFLQLNSPYCHGVIIKAFTEIWNGVFSMRSNTTTGAKKQVHYYYGY
ncbi:ovate family protein [Salix suchowensis]|nr:ovate family protein [Salix suchowensis]